VLRLGCLAAWRGYVLEKAQRIDCRVRHGRVSLRVTPYSWYGEGGQSEYNLMLDMRMSHVRAIHTLKRVVRMERCSRSSSLGDRSGLVLGKPWFTINCVRIHTQCVRMQKWSLT
jgi:hypothetical protein